MKLVFRHYADENHDGKTDAAVLEVLDPELNWVDHWLIIKSSHFDGVIDSGWHFKERISEKTGDLTKTGDTYVWNGVGRKAIPEDFIAEKSKMISILNENAKACGLTGESFHHE